MSETDYTADDFEPKGERLGLLAEFAGPDELVAAAEKATDDGYKRVEAFSPFAILGIDEALKAKGTILPWIVVTLGVVGCVKALAMQLYMNGVEIAGIPWGLSGYDFQISGKPGFSSIPAFIPVTFEVIILLSAFGAFFGMLILNKLPRLSNPLLRSERFESATTDGFFLFVEAKDGKYAEAETEAYLKSIGATAVEPIDSIVEGRQVPAMFYLVGVAAACLATVPPAYIWAVSSSTSTVPRISWFKDMEDQAKFKAQTTSTLFADGRAARKPVLGTVARGSGKDDYELYYGLKPEANLVALPGAGDLVFGADANDSDGNRNESPFRLVSDDAEGDAAAEADTAAMDPAAMDPAAQELPESAYVDAFPEALVLDESFMERGEQRFNIHCAACHGLAGNGDGLVSQRALSLQQGTWVQPTSIHVDSVRDQPVGKLFNTISHGVRKMPGYKEHIEVRDRWAIVLYLRALQRSQNAAAEDLPEEKRRQLADRT